MRRTLSKPVVVFHALLFGMAILVAQQTPPGQPQDPNAQGAPSAPAAIAESGLLPVFGAGLTLDKSWVDGKKFPSDQPNAGISDALEQLYTTQLAPCGFNVVRVPFDVNDPKGEESIKLANLCVWAQQKGLKIAPVLNGSEVGKPLSKDYAAKTKSFVTSVLTHLKKDNAALLPAYTQISFYQLGYPLNNPAYHGVVDPATAADTLKTAASGLHEAEMATAGDAGLSPSQIMAPASFDFELLKGGAMAGTQLPAEAYAQAFETLKGFLAPLAESADIGMFTIEWYPGSITSDATEKLPELIRSLMTDVQGKLIVLSTGFSTAFKTHEDQSRFYALGFSNMADLRAAEGVECPFTGVIWNTAIDTSGANAAPPSDKTAQNVTQWDLSAKAPELIKMWQEGGGDPDLAWWWKKTSSSFGVFSVTDGVFSPKQAHQVLTELQGATAQAAVESGVAETAQKLEDVQAQAAQAQADPNALPIDPNTGLPIDPNTGKPIDPNNPPIDPNTGLPIDPNAGGAAAPPGSNPFQPVMDELKNTLNGALSQLLGGIIEKGKMGLTNLIGRLLGGTGLAGTPGIDPNTGLPIDASGGAPIDPNTGLPIDPNTGLPIDPNNPPIDPNTGLPITTGGGGAGDPTTTGGGGATTGGDPGSTGGSPGGAAPSGTADLVFEGSPSVPTSLTTGEPLTVNVSMKNNGDSPAAGATIYLVDQDGNAFAATDPPVVVQPGETASGTLSFNPPSAGSIPGVKLLLFCENEANPGDNQQDIGSMSITDPPGGDPGESGVGDPGGGSDPGTGGGGRPGGIDLGGIRPGGGKGGKVGGFKGIDISRFRPGLLAIKPALGITLRIPGIKPKLSFTKPGGFNIGGISPSGSAKLVQEDDDPELSEGGSGLRRKIGFQVGQSLPLNVPLTNPFRKAFSNVRAMLYIDGRLVATRFIGSVMPKQTRTVAFNEFKPPAGGGFQAEVRFDAQGPRGKSYQARAGGSISALDTSKGAKPLVRPGMVPSAGLTKAGTLTPGGPLVRPMPRPIGGLVPMVVKTSLIRPVLTTFRPTLGTGGIAPAGTAPKTFTMPVVRSFTMASRAVVGILPDDVSINPFPPAERAMVTTSVRVQNKGMAVAKAVKVEAFLDGKSLRSQTLDVPAGQQAIAANFDKFAAALGQHTLKVTLSFDGQTQETSKAFEVKKGVMIARPMIMLPMAGSLAFTGNDIQFLPVPQPSKPTSITLNVRNPGGGTANAQFEAFADGRSLGKVSKPVGAFQTVNVAGFSAWSPPAGTHTVRVVASVSGRQIAAEKSVNVMPLRTFTSIVRPALTLPGSMVRPGAAQPGGLTRPGLLPGAITRPGTGVQPGGTTRPGGTPPPGGTTQPGGTLQPGGGITRPGTLIRPGGGNAPDVGIALADISFSPPNPKAEQDVVIHVKVHNFGGADATAAMLAISYHVDNEADKTLRLPVNVAAGQELPRAWKVRLNKGSKLFVQAVVTHSADTNNANSTVRTTLNLGAPLITRPGTLVPGGGLTRPPVTGGGTPVRPGGGTTPTGPPPGGTLIPVRPGGVLPGGGLRVGLTPDVAITASDITYAPGSVKEGDTLNFTVRVRNIGQGAGTDTRLSLTLNKDGAAHETREFTLNVPAGQTVSQGYSVRVPRARQLQLNASVTNLADRNTSNQQASATVNVAPSSLTLAPIRPGGIRPGGLTLGALPPDVMLGVGSVTPSVTRARIGDTVSFAVRVGNAGRGAAKGATLDVEFLVDGRRASGQRFTFDINAGGTFNQTVRFRVPAGRQVMCRATVSATGDSNAGNNQFSASVAVGL